MRRGRQRVPRPLRADRLAAARCARSHPRRANALVPCAASAIHSSATCAPVCSVLLRRARGSSPPVLLVPVLSRSRSAPRGARERFASKSSQFPLLHVSLSSILFSSPPLSCAPCAAYYSLSLLLPLLLITALASLRLEFRLVILLLSARDVSLPVLHCVGYNHPVLLDIARSEEYIVCYSTDYSVFTSREARCITWRARRRRPRTARRSAATRRRTSTRTSRPRSSRYLSLSLSLSLSSLFSLSLSLLSLPLPLSPSLSLSLLSRT